MAIDSLQLWMELQRINRSSNEAIFTLRRKDDGAAIGRLSLFHRRIINRSRGQGSEGSITNPPEHYFPSRITVDRKPEGRK